MWYISDIILKDGTKHIDMVTSESMLWGYYILVFKNTTNNSVIKLYNLDSIIDFITNKMIFGVYIEHGIIYFISYKKQEVEIMNLLYIQKSNRTNSIHFVRFKDGHLHKIIKLLGSSDRFGNFLIIRNDKLFEPIVIEILDKSKFDKLYTKYQIMR